MILLELNLMIKRIVKMEFEDEKVNDFKVLFQQYQSKIINQDGCHSVELFQDTQSKNIFFTYSSWESQVHLDQYRNSALFKNVWNHVKKLFNAKPLAWSVKEIL